MSQPRSEWNDELGTDQVPVLAVRRGASSVGKECVLVVLVVACQFFNAGCRRQGLVKSVYRVDYATGECVNCSSKDDQAALRAVWSFRGNPAIRAWAASRFWSRLDPDDREAGAQSTPTEPFGRLGRLLSSGFTYVDKGIEVDYETRRVFPWDFHEGWMKVHGGLRGLNWERRLPLMSYPVYPFIEGNYAMFVGGNTESSRLLIMDLRIGMILTDFVPDSEPDGIGNPNSLYRLPFYKNGYIYFEGKAQVDFSESLEDCKDGAFRFKEVPNSTLSRLSYCNFGS